jgi:hypothetical protein
MVNETNTRSTHRHTPTTLGHPSWVTGGQQPTERQCGYSENSPLSETQETCLLKFRIVGSPPHTHTVAKEEEKGLVQLLGM